MGDFVAHLFFTRKINNNINFTRWFYVESAIIRVNTEAGVYPTTENKDRKVLVF